MASARTSFKLLCICTLVLALLVADVSARAVPADVNERQPAAMDTAESTNKFHFRGDVATEAAEAVEALEAVEQEFSRRELNDYGGKPAKPNCSYKGTCNR